MPGPELLAPPFNELVGWRHAGLTAEAAPHPPNPKPFLGMKRHLRQELPAQAQNVPLL